jgi:hypothetical protein
MIHVLRMKRTLLAIMAALGLAVAVAGPAAAGPEGQWCKTVNNTDGTHAFAACLTHFHGYGSDNWETQDQLVWNISPANGGHTDLMTNVVWHGTRYANGGGGTETCDTGNIADGGTDVCPQNIWLNSLNSTVWVEVHDAFAPTCNRVFFANDGSISTTTC